MPSSGMQRYGPCMHDAAYKLLFSHPRMVEDLLRGFAASGWSDSLDFATLKKLPSEFVSEDLRRRSGDGVWRVRFRDEWLQPQYFTDSRLRTRICLHSLR